jgi:hypothetical protein
MQCVYSPDLAYVFALPFLQRLRLHYIAYMKDGVQWPITTIYLGIHLGCIYLALSLGCQLID